MRLKRFSGISGISLLLFLSILARAPVVSADVSPGDVIDKTNWQEVEGLLPGSVLSWVKKGEFILNIGELNYDQREYFTPLALKSLKENIGKYDVNEEDIIVDAKTGKPPEFVEGIPFPDIDPTDPKAGQKYLYNKHYYAFTLGNDDVNFQTRWVGRSGFEREIGGRFLTAPMDGYIEARSLRNPDNIQRYTLISVTEPYDIAGFNLLLWRYRDTRQDITLSYIPAIRRARRMSPANRSDAFVGSDFCVDDPYGYDGKIPYFHWRVIKEQEALVPYKSADPEKFVRGKRGEWKTTADVTPSVYGYQTEGWQGAPWAPVNFIWVKKSVVVIAATAKDPYYNYGRQEMWFDPQICFPRYKVILDRSGEYWKTMLISVGAIESQDKQMRFMMLNIQDMVDDRSQHASLTENASKRNIWKYFVEVDMNDFTLSGFQKYCK